jgi:hypothetical protein
VLIVIDERARHELYLGVEEVLGTERADTLMSLLPPVGWADVATKDDIRLLQGELNNLEARMNVRFAELETTLERGLREQTRTLMFGLVGSVFTIGSICLAAIGVAG